MKILIIGAGKVGAYIAQDLCREGHDVTVVDLQADRLRQLSGTLDVNCVEGNGTDVDLMLEAGGDSADMFIAATGSDERNLICCLAARRLGAKHTIARLREPVYLNQRALLQDDLELYLAISPDRETAAEINRILEFPSAARVETFSNGRAELVEYRIPVGGKLDGGALKDLSQKFRARVLIFAVKRNGEVTVPRGEFVLQAGDTINVAGAREELRNFFKNASAYKKAARNVLIMGGSRIATILAQQLCRTGMQVTILEKDEAKAESLSSLLPKTRIVCGDGAKPEVLREEGLFSADAFVALTGNDEQNIIISMYAQACGVGRVVTKVNDEDLTGMLAGSGLDCFVSPKQLAANQIVASARALFQSGSGSVETLYRLVDDQIEALEFSVGEGSRCVGKPLMDLKIRSDVLVASVLRDERVQAANGSTVLRPGDKTVVITTLNGLANLDDILEA